LTKSASSNVQGSFAHGILCLCPEVTSTSQASRIVFLCLLASLQSTCFIV